MSSTIRTGVLLIALTALFLWIGNLIAGETGLIFAFILALAMNFFSYWYSDKLVLTIYRARPLSEEDAPQVYRALRELIQNAHLPMPRVFITPMQAPNAFATGRNPKNACICVTQGLLELLEFEELKGVLSHELAHIKNRDTLIQTVTATIAGAIMFLAQMARWVAIFGGYGGRDRERGGNVLALILVAIVAPIAALLIQMAISRQREFQADAGGAKFSRNPLGLANALLKLENYSRYSRAEVSPATAHLFIVNPLRGRSLLNLFSTHPPIALRVERLRKLAG